VSRFWFSLLPEPPEDAFAAAPVSTLDERPAGWLAAWTPDRRRPLHALAIDERVVDPEGDEAWVSLCLAPRGTRVLYDDPSVCEAMRVVLAGSPVAAMSTLARDSSTIGGALTAVRGGAVRYLQDDPFARIFPPRLLRVAPGFIGDMLPPTGPGIQRYSGAPWPWSRF
jgi:hypothetical protein